MSRIKRRLDTLEKKVFQVLPVAEDTLWDRNPIGCYVTYVVVLDYQKAHPEDFTEEDIAATEERINHGEALLPQLKQDRNDPEVKEFYKKLDYELYVCEQTVPESIQKLVEQNKAKAKKK
ncbi:MAG: hypothetical protein ACYS76_09185 [Planctomycetota bacterium]|jgi:hypothetical protein